MLYLWGNLNLQGLPSQKIGRFLYRGGMLTSHSSASGLGEPEDEDALEASLSATAAAYSAYLLADRSLFSEEIESLDKNLEDLLTRVDEFVGMLDIIRSDSSQVVNESLPQIYTKATEMRHIYRKIDKLEAFVKMIGNSVAGLEERVIKAETDLGAFPNTFKKILHTISIPSFLNKSSSSRQQQTLYEPPVLFKTEDYFPCVDEAPY
ncbi:biogenesis of lysosome-related organelles complex 1 subunit 4 [Patagioenas fasciata monilis]|uniref:Biogenesis of lysosome-related organelles complex 1 subunit 4 n=1 Tax=Patagioenas fasciata monilis TaxID=372326 RepID=A0A1V4J8Y8_PATFA|nr:biogenesis of lysosome-related organelles complex 1 subunit 4 [Patagioenas fasciata monilis]